MSREKIILTGASGFLGWHFLKKYAEEYEIIGIYSSNKWTEFKNVTWVKFDFLNPKNSSAFYNFLEKEKPDWVLNFAAAANPNFCEENPETSKTLNRNLPIALSNSCFHLGIKLLHCSTDLVFDGESTHYPETAPTNPISVYGHDKSTADFHILKTNKNAIVARLPLMFGLNPNGAGFFHNWIEKLKSGEKLFAFTDEFRTAASCKRVVQGIHLLIKKEENGLFHLGGLEKVSRFDFAKRLAQFLKIKNPEIIPSVRADVKMAAARPKDVSLNIQKAQSIGYQPKSLEEEFAIILMEN